MPGVIGRHFKVKYWNQYLKMSPGDFDVHPGWNIIDSHYSRAQVM